METKDVNLKLVFNPNGDDAFGAVIDLEIDTERLVLATGKNWEEVLGRVGKWLDNKKLR